MSSHKSENNFFAAVISVVFAGVLFKLLADIFSESKTDIISDKGLSAINDPDKKREIDEAFAASERRQKETGIWENPVVDLN